MLEGIGGSMLGRQRKETQAGSTQDRSLRAYRIPRLEYQEADDLSNFVFSVFEPRYRLVLNLEDLKFDATQDLFAEGVDFLGIVARRAGPLAQSI